MTAKKTPKKSATKGTKASSKKSVPTGPDKRKDLRIPVQLLVDYKSDGNYLFDFCRDLGTGGVFIQTKTPLSQGSDIELTFTIPDSKETLRTNGTVIWVQAQIDTQPNLIPGMGVQFAGFDSEQRKILESFIKRYATLKDPDALATQSA